MTYIQNHNDNRGRSYRKSGYIVFILIVIIIAFRIFMPNVTSGFFTAIARPFWRIEFSINNGQLRSNEQLLNDNQELLRKLEIRDVELKSTALLVDENEELKSLLGRASSTKNILAAVLQRPPIAVYDELVIDIGADMGLSDGDIVYAAHNVPIGKIVDISAHTSKVLLFSSPGQSYNVFIGKSNIAATAIGRGGGQYSVELPRSADVSQGDHVSIPSMRGNLYGIVGSIIADPSATFETVLFSAPINIYQLKWVYVEKK
ncbi:MAG: rod shape-determining protein MreC [Candidatus Taylorbacteria bacterium]